MIVRRNKKQQEKKEGFIIRAVRSLFRDWDIKVMSYVMVIVSAISLISGTVAWFTYYPLIKAKDMNIKLADCESLKVSVIQDGTDLENINVLPGDCLAISLNIPMFISGEVYETEEYVYTNYMDSQTVSPEKPVVTTIATKEKKNVTKLEPGSFGEMKFYVTSLDREINYCRVTPYILLDYNDGSKDEMDLETWQLNRVDIPEDGTAFSEEKIEELRTLSMGHFLMFAERKITLDDTGEQEKYEYEEQIFLAKTGSNAGPLEVPLKFDIDSNVGEEKEIVIYWCWPYEYTDIPQEVKNNIVWSSEEGSGLLPNYFFQEQKNSDGTKIQFTDILDDEAASIYYDEADVNLGTYVKGIKFILKIEGYYNNSETAVEDVTANMEEIP